MDLVRVCQMAARASASAGEALIGKIRCGPGDQRRDLSEDFLRNAVRLLAGLQQIRKHTPKLTTVG
jgi:hypothetical protein